MEKKGYVLEPFRKNALELAKLVHKICKEHEIKYTLLNSSLWGASDFKGFLPWVETIQLGMFFCEFRKFIDICNDLLDGTDYYIIDSRNTEQFEHVIARVAKRSKVVLPESRKKDIIYYDYFIDIIPIFYAGNSLKEYNSVLKSFRYNFRCLNSYKIAPDTVKISNFFEMVKRNYYYSKRNEHTFSKTENSLMKYINSPTKYVILPFLQNQKGISRLTSTYENLVEVDFEGEKFFSVKEHKRWVNDFYGKKKKIELLKSKINVALLKGPEFLRRIQLIELEMLVEFDEICRKNDLKYVLLAGTLLGAVRHKGFIPWDDDIDVSMPYDDYLKFIEVSKTQLDLDKYFLRTQESDQDCNLVFATLKRNGTIYCKANRDKYNTHLGVPIDILPFSYGHKSRIIHKIQFIVSKFLRTVVWAHMGADSERKVLKRFYYKNLAKIPHKKAYDLYIKIVTMQKEKTDRLFYIAGNRNPYFKAFNKMDCFINRVEIEFEGHKFFIPKNYVDVLEYSYSSDYMRFPLIHQRMAKHLPGIIQIGDLYEYN